MLKFKKVHEDERGEIDIIVDDEDWKDLKEITILTTKEGFARGGSIHNLNEETCLVVDGEIEYHMRGFTERLRAGDRTLVPVGIPHYFISLTNSTVIEYGATPEEKKEKDPEIGRIVDQINKERLEREKMKKKEIDWNCRLDKLAKQLGIHGAFNNKPCCGKCESSTGLRVMELSKDKKIYVCPRCGNILKVEFFKKYMERE